MSDMKESSPVDRNDEQAVAQALTDDVNEGQLQAVAEDEQALLAAGITSHVLRCGLRSANRVYINDLSSFKTPHTDQYQVRVALYNAQGERVYLGPFRDKGSGTGYNTLLHTEAVWDDHRLTARSLVLWRSVNGGTLWTNWKNC